MNDIIWKKVTTWNGELLLRVQGENESWIPQDEANANYQAYLEWVAEGNTAEVVEG